MTIQGQFVGVKEAASILGCTDSNIRKLIAAGTLRAHSLSDRVYVVCRESLDKYAARKIKAGRPRKNSEKVA